MRIPADEKGLIGLAQEMVEICGVSQGARGAAYKQYAQYIETGNAQGGMSLANVLYAHNDRLASHLFCPTDARFSIDFENIYQKNILMQGQEAARIVTRAFGRRNFDLTYSDAVRMSLDYGAAIIKLTGKTEMMNFGEKQISHIKDASARVVPPWLIGVENEGKNSLDEQEAICETVYLSKYDVWRRICNMPDAENLYKKVIGHSSKSGGPGMPSSFIQVLSTSTLTIPPSSSNPATPGGLIQINGDPSYATVGPQILEDQIPMRELWLKDDERADWLMVQMIDPGILISPRFRRTNEFCSGLLPYLMVQPNVVPGYIWGRSEIVDLTSLQTALSTTMDDLRRIIGEQYDKRLAFEGFDGDPQEMYDDFRSQGWINGRQGSKVTDLTPGLPPGAIEYIKLIRSTMEDVSGFGNILSGQGEAGVRAGNHAQTLMKTASPRLRDRSLLVERQYATFGDRYLSYMESKDGMQYYTDEKDPENTAFLLADLPDDRRVTVDSHSSSPVYENDHNQLAVFGLKTGLLDGEDAIEMLNFPNKDELKRKWKQREEAKAKLIQDHPELLTKGRGATKK